MTPEPLWSPQQLADYLAVPVRTIYQWRSRHGADGPPGMRVGRHIRYRPSDIDAWIESRLSTADPDEDVN